MEIKTNNHWRLFLNGNQLPKHVRKQFDHLSDEEFNCGSFVKYKGYFYEMSDFLRLSVGNLTTTQNWDGYHADSYWSGVLIKVSPDGDHYKIATFRNF
jgi:hypothetical protein